MELTATDCNLQTFFFFFFFQEVQFEKLTRELEAERASVAHKVDKVG